MRKVLLLVLVFSSMLFSQVTTKTGVELIKHYEGFRAKSYVCPAGYLTVGFGHLTKKPIVVTRYEAELLLVKDLGRFEKYVRRSTERLLIWHEFDALVSFTFNLGYRLDKRFRYNINEGNTNAVTYRMRKYVYGGGRVLPGLVARRRSETILYRKGILDFK